MSTKTPHMHNNTNDLCSAAFLDKWQYDRTATEEKSTVPVTRGGCVCTLSPLTLTPLEDVPSVDLPWSVTDESWIYFTHILPSLPLKAIYNKSLLNITDVNHLRFNTNWSVWPKIAMHCTVGYICLSDHLFGSHTWALIWFGVRFDRHKDNTQTCFI